jgi:YD repeat-containing protein
MNGVKFWREEKKKPAKGTRGSPLFVARSMGVALGLSLLTLSELFAGVALRNGNFYIGFKDIAYSGGLDLKIERVCNSKTRNYEGRFGKCWGNEFESRIQLNPDGSLSVKEFGGGAENVFRPANFKPADIDTAIAGIVQAQQSAGAQMAAPAWEQYKKRLKSDAEFRSQEYERLQRARLIAPKPIPVNTQFYANQFSYQYITKVAGGFIRVNENGKVERFTEAGLLNRIEEKSGAYLTFQYDALGRLARIEDNLKRRLEFKLNAAGRVERIDGDNGKYAEYKYDARGMMVQSRDAAGGVYQYKQDEKGLLVEIAFPDKTIQQMTYYGPEMNENVKSVKERNGNTTSYVYTLNPADSGYLKVAIKTANKEGKSISDKMYEFFIKKKVDGGEYTYKLIEDLDGERTETVYNECCGLPLIIKRNSEETAFEYDAKGRVLKKTTPWEVTQLTYDPKAGKVQKVVKIPRPNGTSVSIEYKYDDRGNLTLARSSTGEGVQLFYDAAGRIIALKDSSNRKLEFKYNENNKPVEISDARLGKMTMSYNKSGEVETVESSADRKISSEVTAAFNAVLKLTRPAGVTLSM